jgi:hypothetical protein
MALGHSHRFMFFISLFCLSLVLASCQSEVVDPDLSTGSANGLNKSTNGVVQRDINDFVSTQIIYWYWTDPNDPNPKFFISDFAGVLNNAYGLNISSTYEGKITEKALSDGTAEVRVMLKAHNVLTYVLNGSSQLLFGERPSTILGGATPTLGDANLDITFINSAPGAPIPELYYMTNVSKLSMNASAFGPFKSLAGFGPDGTPGHAWVNQVGLLTKVNGKPGIDGFAVEYVKLQPVGKTP